MHRPQSVLSALYIAGRGVYDNMTTAVSKVVLNRDYEINPRSVQMSSHCLITPKFYTPQASWEKGHIENQIMTLRDALFKSRLAGETLDEVIERLSERCCRHALGRPHSEFPEMKVTEAFSHEERR